MHVIGTVGLPGSGKGEAATVAREAGIPVVTMGDVVRQETAERDLDPTKDHGRVAQALRDENGPAAIAERSLPMIEARLENHDTVLVDGIRSDVEVTVFEERFGEHFTLVSVEAPFEVRAERIDSRGRDTGADNGGESLADRDERELGWGMGEAMADADVVVENTDSLEGFHRTISEIVDASIESDRATEPAGTTPADTDQTKTDQAKTDHAETDQAKTDHVQTDR